MALTALAAYAILAAVIAWLEKGRVAADRLPRQRRQADQHRELGITAVAVTKRLRRRAL
jgi:hypothetical protein